MNQISFGSGVGEFHVLRREPLRGIVSGRVQQVIESRRAARQSPVAAIAERIAEIEVHGDAECQKSAEKNRREPERQPDRERNVLKVFQGASLRREYPMPRTVCRSCGSVFVLSLERKARMKT